MFILFNSNIKIINKVNGYGTGTQRTRLGCIPAPVGESILTAQNIEKTAEKVIVNSTKEDMDLKSVKKVNVQSSNNVNMF